MAELNIELGHIFIYTEETILHSYINKYECNIKHITKDKLKDIIYNLNNKINYIDNWKGLTGIHEDINIEYHKSYGIQI